MNTLQEKFEEKLHHCLSNYGWYSLREQMGRIPPDKILEVTHQALGDEDIASVSLLMHPGTRNRRLPHAHHVLAEALPGIKAELHNHIPLNEDSPLWNFLVVVATQLIQERRYIKRAPGDITGDRPAA